MWGVVWGRCGGGDMWDFVTGSLKKGMKRCVTKVYVERLGFMANYKGSTRLIDVTTRHWISHAYH